ncbi:Membrane protein insertase YidC [Pelagimonas phthalicica]|uniref:Membrane protein insertase YidC n=1 Tax=Pelagimonas phthalicica TaxID=1037362 RepID=A0A238JGQ9_9RHOB|nr:membrane protein insertase YidC [Pelagimonas phthalicica]TDS89713.1 YidC/Oxa1 family membrane protein insertase [Pelagimonas phthalicica]SMX29881.1 Membrane protein insertase YidC [Pelagimonas phthalicica]
MDEQNKNLFLATALSFVVILVWFVLFPPPEQPPEDPNAPVAVEGQPPVATGDVAAAPTAAPGTAPAQPDAEADTKDAPRVALSTDRLEGSISLVGGRIDDLRLKDYRVTIEEDSEIVQFLSPVGSENPYYALYGWAPGAGLQFDDVPGANTEWRVETGETLGLNAPVILRWDSPTGLIFRRSIAIDENYMFSVTQSVENPGQDTVSLAPYGILARHGEPQDLKNFFILHEGALQMTDGILEMTDYSDMPDLDVDSGERAPALTQQVTEGGWVGFTDHYWMSVLIPQQGSGFSSVIKYEPNRDIYQSRAMMPTITLAAGQTQQVTTQLFAGAKEWETIRAYEKSGIDGFINSIDWGWFSFLTKPIFTALHWLNAAIGNMGWAIIGLTLLIKAILFPLAYKSYVSMAKMKELQPEMEKIKERAGDDREKLQKEMMALYKKEKVNPASGCLPILLQIPIFFSLYKVIFVTLELRHAAWLGPFNDLSAPDPTSIFNLFGIFPWAGPEAGSILALVFIGILPLLLGISMWLQQKLNPAPTDPTQQMIFAWMPWVFMFMLGGFASGLVVYWIANNTITFTQQYLIMRSQGFKPDILGNIKASFKKAEKPETK